MTHLLGVYPIVSKAYEQETGSPRQPTPRSYPISSVIKGKVFAQSYGNRHGNRLSMKRGTISNSVRLIGVLETMKALADLH
jgi:hypothetical protein